MSTRTYSFPVERSPQFFDDEGILSYCKRPEDVTNFVFDWSDQMDDNTATITIAANGPTVTEEWNADNQSGFMVTGVGEIVMTCVTANGETMTKVVRFYPPTGQGWVSDYDER